MLLVRLARHNTILVIMYKLLSTGVVLAVEIVVSVVLEGGYSGVSSAQYIAKAVFDAYFQ